MPSLALNDGGLMAYDDIGTGRPIILVHGWAMHAGFFVMQREYLSVHYRVITPDLRGHGRSTSLPEDSGVETLIDDLGALLCSLDIQDAILVGWSMGAMIVWGTIAQDKDNRIAGLVTEDMSPCIMNDDDWHLGLPHNYDSNTTTRAIDLMEQDWKGFCQVFVPRIFAAGHEAERKNQVHWTLAQAEQNDPASMIMLWQSMGRQDFRTTVRKIRQPALIVYGEHSQLYGAATATWLAENMPLAQLVAFKNSGHAPHLEESKYFNHIIRKFAGDLATGVKTG